MSEKAADSPVRIIGSRELHQNLPGILKELESDKVRYVLTVHGKPRAVLIGAEPYLNLILDGKPQQSARGSSTHGTAGGKPRYALARRPRASPRSTKRLSPGRRSWLIPKPWLRRFRRRPFIHSGAKKLHHTGKNRDHDDGENDQMEVLLNRLQAAEPPAAEGGTEAPTRYRRSCCKART